MRLRQCPYLLARFDKLRFKVSLTFQQKLDGSFYFFVSHVRKNKRAREEGSRFPVAAFIHNINQGIQSLIRMLL